MRHEYDPMMESRFDIGVQGEIVTAFEYRNIGLLQ